MSGAPPGHPGGPGPGAAAGTVWLVDYPRTTAILAKRLQECFAPRTVVWLDELRHFTSPDAQVLAELADMLTVSSQVVAIATLWPAHWAAYTRQSGPELTSRMPRSYPRQPADVITRSLRSLRAQLG
jgi:hypothetical protein